MRRMRRATPPAWDVEVAPGGEAHYKTRARGYGGSRHAMKVHIPKDIWLMLDIIPGDIIEVKIKKIDDYENWKNRRRFRGMDDTKA